MRNESNVYLEVSFEFSEMAVDEEDVKLSYLLRD
jgi:hypothetical protein